RTRLSARVRVARADRVRSLHRRLVRRACAPTAVAAPNRRIGGVNPYLVDRLQPLRATIFAQMSAPAVETGAINLGAAFPDTDGPDAVADAAMEAINGGLNQSPPGIGVPELRRAVRDHQRRFYDLDFDADTEILVTAGATEAIAAALLALCGPGDEVV